MSLFTLNRVRGVSLLLLPREGRQLTAFAVETAPSAEHAAQPLWAWWMWRSGRDGGDGHAAVKSRWDYSVRTESRPDPS